MRKSIFLMVLSLVAVLAVACGGGNGANNKAANGAGGNGGGTENGGGGDAAAEDAMAFYKTVGNFSLTKTTSKMKMGEEWTDQPASFTRMEVTKVDGNNITYKMTTYDADMKETYSAEQTMDLTPKDAPEGDTPAPEMTKEEVEVKAGKFDCIKTEASGSTSWSHKGMSVKSVMKSDMMESTTELQEYKLD